MVISLIDDNPDAGAAANWRPWLALAAVHLMAYGDTLVRDAVLV